MLMETRSKVRQIEACKKFIINTCHLDAVGQCMVVVFLFVCACVEKMADMERRLCGVDPQKASGCLFQAFICLGPTLGATDA